MADNTGMTLGSAAVAGVSTSASSLGFIEIWGIFVGIISLAIAIFSAYDTYKWRRQNPDKTGKGFDNYRNGENKKNK